MKKISDLSLKQLLDSSVHLPTLLLLLHYEYDEIIEKAGFGKMDLYANNGFVVIKLANLIRFGEFDKEMQRRLNLAKDLDDVDPRLSFRLDEAGNIIAMSYSWDKYPEYYPGHNYSDYKSALLGMYKNTYTMSSGNM